MGLVDVSVRYFESRLIYLGPQPFAQNSEIPNLVNIEDFYTTYGVGGANLP